MKKEQLFNLVCFCVLMENSGGIVDKSPDYILEKFERITQTMLFPALDSGNGAKALEWFSRWIGEDPTQFHQDLHRWWNDTPANEMHEAFSIPLKGEDDD